MYGLHLFSYLWAKLSKQEDSGIGEELGGKKSKTVLTYFEYRTIGAHIFRTFPFSNMSITPGKLLEVFIIK